MNNILFSTTIFNSIISSLIISFFLGDFFKINQIDLNLTYLVTYLVYLTSSLFLLRLILTVPLYFVFNFFSKKLAYIWFNFIELFLFLFVIGEIKLYTSQGLHVYDKVVIKTLLNSNFNKEIGIGAGSIAVLASIILFFIITQLAIKKITVCFKKNIIIASGVAITFSFLWVIFSFIPGHGNVSNIYPFYSILKGTPIQKQMSLNYNFDEKILFTKKPNILFILAESLRADFLTKKRMPKLTELFHTNKCSSLKRAYSGGHTTEYGVFASLYGVYGYHFDNFKQKKITSHGLKLLTQNNYNLLGGSASGLNNWNDSAFMFTEFKPYKEFLSGKVYKDDQTLKRWLLQKVSNINSPTFIFSFFNSTHHSYYFPDKFKIHTPITGEIYNHLYTSGSKKSFQKKLFNRYKNSALYLDDLIFDYITKAKKKLGEDTIIVFSGDHGEEFWEEGLHGHGKTNYINERINVPLVICNGKRPLQLQNFGSHADIFPTLIDILTDKKSLAFNGESLQREREVPYLVITAPQFPYGRNKVGIIHQKYKFWMKRSGNSIHELYKYRTTDLNDKTINNGEDIKILNDILIDFSKSAYKFLKEK